MTRTTGAGWLRGVHERAPLRVRLAALLVVLVLLGLVAVGFASTTALRAFLLGRVDDQLEAVSGRRRRVRR